MSSNNGGPAFPCLYPRADEDGRQGLSLLDWFAGQALAHEECAVFCKPSGIAEVAYEIASAMLAEKAKREKQ